MTDKRGHGVRLFSRRCPPNRLASGAVTEPRCLRSFSQDQEKRRRKWEKVRKSSYVGGRIYRQLQRLKALPPPSAALLFWHLVASGVGTVGREGREGKGREPGKGCGSGWEGRKLEEKGEKERVVVACFLLNSAAAPALSSALRRPPKGEGTVKCEIGAGGVGGRESTRPAAFARLNA